MKKRGAILVLVSAFALVGPANAPASTDSVLPEMRLLGAIQLWGDIRLFDPQVAEGGVDWDAAFMNAEPAILAATTRDSYAAAIQRMLSPLSDAETRVTGTSAPFGIRLTVAQVSTAVVITVAHGTQQQTPDEAIEADETRVVAAASKSRDIVFDLRGINDSNDADAEALYYLFTIDSPMMALFSGDITLPRARSRQYLGYPDDGSIGFQGYSAQDSISDATVLHGKSKVPHRFAFLVDDSTTLPLLAIALNEAGEAAIYSAHGQPAAPAAGSSEMRLPDGVGVTYRTGDLAEIADRQQFASAIVTGVPDAVARLQAQPPRPAVYASSAPERFANTSYADQVFPNQPMRMLAVARVYNVIRYFSPYRDLMHDDWDAAALQAIRDERSATDARSYIMGLLRFYAHLHDSHGGFPSSRFVETEFGFGPPFVARYVHGQVVVTHILVDAGPLHGLRVGDVIQIVDGVPVRTAMERIEPYICSSTQQSADYAALGVAGHPSVFSGRRGTTLTVQFRHAGSSTPLSATFVRSAIRAQAVSAPVYAVLPGNVGYVDFDRIKPSEVDAMFAALKNTRAIVFDNRGYPQGAAWEIAPRLTTATTVRLALFNTPYVIEPLSTQEGDSVALPTYRQFYQMLGTADGPRYLKPTVMLIDERAISQSEHSALFFRETGHTRFVGMPTRGANGDVTSMVLPGALYFNFSGEGVRWPDGRQLQRVGIIPDVRVEPTAQDIATGNDVILQRGLDEALRISGAGVRVRRAAVQQEIARERSQASQPR